MKIFRRDDLRHMFPFLKAGVTRGDYTLFALKHPLGNSCYLLTLVDAQPGGRTHHYILGENGELFADVRPAEAPYWEAQRGEQITFGERYPQDLGTAMHEASWGVDEKVLA